MDRETEREFQRRISEGLRRSYEVAGLKSSESGGEPKVSMLRFELNTLPKDRIIDAFCTLVENLLAWRDPRPVSQSRGRTSGEQS